MKRRHSTTTGGSKLKATTGRKRRRVVCVSNPGYPASPERRKIYVSIPYARAEARGLLRVIDESGEAYLFPPRWFRQIRLDDGTARALRRKPASR